MNNKLNKGNTVSNRYCSPLFLFKTDLAQPQVFLLLRGSGHFCK